MECLGFLCVMSKEFIFSLVSFYLQSCYGEHAASVSHSCEGAASVSADNFIRYVLV